MVLRFNARKAGSEIEALGGSSPSIEARNWW